jgi:hypothetical protein
VFNVSVRDSSGEPGILAATGALGEEILAQRARRGEVAALDQWIRESRIEQLPPPPKR